MVFVFDFLSAENKITLIQRQAHKHHKQANVIRKCKPFMCWIMTKYIIPSDIA